MTSYLGELLSVPRVPHTEGGYLGISVASGNVSHYFKKEIYSVHNDVGKLHTSRDLTLILTLYIPSESHSFGCRNV